MARSFVVAAAAVAGELEVIQESLSGTLSKLTVIVPAKRCEQLFASAVSKLKRDVVGRVPGFRSADKVPLSVVVQQIGGQKNLKLTAIEEILIVTLPEAMDRCGQRAVDGSMKVLTSAKDLAAVFDPAKPMTYELTFEQLPTVKWIKPYTELQVTVADTGNLETDTAAAEDLIRQYLKEKGHQRVVADRQLQMGDVTIINMEIKQKGGRTPLPGLKKDMFIFDTEQDPLNLSQGMIGMSVGEERTFPIRFPADWHVDLWQGMEAEAKIKLQELFSWALPEFDDAFVQKHYPQFDSAADMRKSLIATTTLERMKEADKKIQDAVMEAVVQCVDVAVPEQIIRDLGAAAYQDRLMSMLNQKLVSWEEVQRMSSEDMMADYVKQKQSELEERAKWMIAADEIYQEQQLQVDEKELQEEVDRAKQDLQSNKLEYDEEALREQSLEQLKNWKVMCWLQSKAKIELQPWVPAEQTGAAEAATA